MGGWVGGWVGGWGDGGEHVEARDGKSRAPCPHMTHQHEDGEGLILVELLVLLHLRLPREHDVSPHPPRHTVDRRDEEWSRPVRNIGLDHEVRSPHADDIDHDRREDGMNEHLWKVLQVVLGGRFLWHREGQGNCAHPHACAGRRGSGGGPRAIILA